MKGGLVQLVFALRSLRVLGVELTVTPVALFNSDEETGSEESSLLIRRFARRANRCYVFEPALGLSGKLKTARKGAGQFTIQIKGRSAHAGLDPTAGTSAILELSYLIQALQALNDPERGISVNVGQIDGGIRPNVVAPSARPSSMSGFPRRPTACGSRRPSTGSSRPSPGPGSRSRARWMCHRWRPPHGIAGSGTPPARRDGDSELNSRKGSPAAFPTGTPQVNTQPLSTAWEPWVTAPTRYTSSWIAAR